MRILRVVLLALWATAAVLLSLLATTVAIAPLILEDRLSRFLVPWIFVLAAVSASAVAAAIARLVRSVALRYSWHRLLISGFAGWLLAWWSGLEALRTLEAAERAGLFAISFSLEHLSLWNAGIFVTAAILLFATTETPHAPVRG
jgi:hypothetical protein